MTLPWGTGQLPEGWRIVRGEGRENSARLVLLQLLRMQEAGDDEGARRLVAHVYQGRPIGEHLVAALDAQVRELVGAPAAPEGALLLPGAQRMVQEETARLGAHPLELPEAPNVEGPWMWWSWPGGEVLAFEQADAGRGVLWREATEAFLAWDAARQERAAADARARRERAQAAAQDHGAAPGAPPAASGSPPVPSSPAAAPNPEAAAPAGEGQGGPAPSPADLPGTATVIVGGQHVGGPAPTAEPPELEAADPTPASSSTSSAGSTTPPRPPESASEVSASSAEPAAGSPSRSSTSDAPGADEDLVEEDEADLEGLAQAGPMGPDVAAAVGHALERARAAAQRTLQEARKVLTIPEQMLSGGVRIPSSPGIRCAFCGQALGHAKAVCREPAQGAFEWAHLACCEREDREGTSVYGTKAAMRLELAEAGVDLNGGECFDELRVAVLTKRRADVRGVDWSAVKPKRARTDRPVPCGLCSQAIAKGDEYREHGGQRLAHERCVSALQGERAA